LFLAPLPFGSVQPGFVLAIELTAAGLGLGTILLIGRDEAARRSIPVIPLMIGLGVVALGTFQIIPLSFAVAQRFNPTAELARPLIPYLGLDPPPRVSWSVAVPETTDALLRFIAYLLVGLAAAVAFDARRSRRRLAMVLVASGVFQAVYGSAEYLTGRQHIFAYAKKYYLESATGTLINRNHLATLLAAALPFALILAIPETASNRATRTRSWRESLVASDGGLGRALAVGAAALIWMGLLLSHSRAGLGLAIIGATLVLVPLRASRMARWTAVVGIVVLLGLLTVDMTQAPGERLLTVRDELEGKSGRPAVWRDAFALVADRPLLGYGLGTFESVFPLVQSADIDLHFDHAHNDWLEWATEGGSVAFALAIALLFVSVRATLNTARSDGFGWRFSMASRAAIVVFALHALVDFSLRIPAVAVMAAALVGSASTRIGRDRLYPSQVQPISARGA
jgi:O-antigen ligase